MKKSIKTVMYILGKCNFLLVFFACLGILVGFFLKAENKKLANFNRYNQVEWKELIKPTANRAVLSRLGHLCADECLL